MELAKINEYIDVLIEGSENLYEQAYLILSARGFLLDFQDNVLSISDNSSENDFVDLNAFLTKNNKGMISDGQIHLSNSSLLEYANLYKETEFISYECITYDRNWKFFKQHIYSPKINALSLEPYIARYLKALSAVGISTSVSCDGNHTIAKGIGQKCAYIGFHSRYDLLWHCSIAELLDLKTEWTRKHNSRVIQMPLDTENQMRVYLNILYDANKIYDNRIRLRELKKEVTTNITERIDNLTDSQVAKLFKCCNKVY